MQLECVLVCLPGLEPVLRVSQGLRFQAIHSALACFRLACTLLTAGSDKPHSSCLRALGAGRWDGPVHAAGNSAGAAFLSQNMLRDTQLVSQISLFQPFLWKAQESALRIYSGSLLSTASAGKASSLTIFNTCWGCNIIG